MCTWRHRNQIIAQVVFVLNFLWAGWTWWNSVIRQADLSYSLYHDDGEEDSNDDNDNMNNKYSKNDNIFFKGDDQLLFNQNLFS